MARDDWYRNADWNPAIEGDYRKRLDRARSSNRPQYLRIQAHHLRESHPQVALRLLDEYFASGDHVDLAQAHADRAGAFAALGDLDAAVGSYEDALQREREFPHARTSAYLDFACLVANERIESLYQRALHVLDARVEGPWFPIQRYEENGARALLLLELGRSDEAMRAAAVAMSAAQHTHSGFRYHPDLGLVRETDDDFGRRVARLARQGSQG